MRRPLVLLPMVVLLAASLVACGDDGDGSVPGGVTTTVPSPGTGGTDTTGGTGTVAPGPPVTTDLDGREPDEVEPPPIGGVPGTAVPNPSPRRVALPGFGEVLVEVRRIDGEIVTWCLLLAETSAQTQRGLMEVTDPGLGGYDGMLFRFDREHEGGFYMRNTPLPLEIAYLSRAGAVVSIRRMDPCDDVDGCPTYPAGGAFQATVEVPVEAGGVAALGLDDSGDTVLIDTGRTCPA